jgi:hypothetical protein
MEAGIAGIVVGYVRFSFLDDFPDTPVSITIPHPVKNSKNSGFPWFSS